MIDELIEKTKDGPALAIQRIRELEFQIEELNGQIKLYQMREGAFECPNCTCAMCARNRQYFAPRKLE